MKFQLLTLVSIATTTLAINLEQVRLINDDELMVQDAQFDYPAIVNLKDQDAEIAKKTSSSSATTTTTAKKDKRPLLLLVPHLLLLLLLNLTPLHHLHLHLKNINRNCFYY